MNWIKSNPFVSILSGLTLVICAILSFVAMKGGTKYEEMKASFDDSFRNVSKAERSPLYPTTENRAAKTKSLTDYSENIDDLRAMFAPYRPGDLDQITPQAFTVRLKAATEKVTAELEAAGCEVPEGFFMGFESYRTRLANSGATALLDYQLKGFENAMLSLAKARPTKLISIFRESVPEESGGNYEAAENEVSRNFGMELTFRGPESSAREFLSELGEIDSYYYMVRCVAIRNDNQEPPKVSDASFEKSRPADEAEIVDDNPFGGDFVFPGAEEEVEEDEEAVPAEEPAEEAPPAAEIDTTRILAQVLGSEEVIVFVRFDLTMFTPVEELPKP